MNDQIINNLYEFWKHIGNLNNRLIETEKYSAVFMDNSDWPNRIFDIQFNYGIIGRIKEFSRRNELPEMITITKPNNFNGDHDLEFVFGQKNMALDLSLISRNMPTNPNIKRVTTERDSIKFANTASESFGYRVAQDVVLNVVNNSESTRLFIYQENNECLGCGIVFFDSNNNAGLHMIGTIPKGRGKGIGKNMTEKLLMEAKENNANYCVLHASLMGESMYKQLGFKAYGKIETYRILKNRNN